MKRNILKILIIISLTIPFAIQADLPILIDGGDGGGVITGGGSNGSGDTTTNGTTTAKSSLYVYTDKPDNVTYTTATLHGTGGDRVSNSTLDITAYFRYSNSDEQPIFCNDIYGTNMISTKDIKLGTTKISSVNKNGNTYNQGSNSFYQKIFNLTPDTEYYYCAILSNRENISYEGLVEKFHTSPYSTTVKTKSATSINTTSAKLNGYYSAIETAITYFQYKKVDDPNWIIKGEETFKIGNSANIYGDISYNLTNLTPKTKYQFRAVAETSSGEEKRIVYGATLNFRTGYDSNGDGGNDDGGGDDYYDDGGNGGNGDGTPTTPGNKVTTTSKKTNTGDGDKTNTTNNRNSSNNNDNDNDYERNINNTNDSIRITNTTSSLALGQTGTPPNDAIVRYHEGVETVFTRQIIADVDFAKLYEYQDGQNLQTFAEDLAHQLAKTFGYVDASGKEIRVSLPDIAAYQLQLIGNKLSVYEYYNNKIVDVRNMTTTFKKASTYEYYFKK